MPDATDISPDMMKLMQGGGTAQNMPPDASPGTQPQQNEGERMQAHAKVQMAMTLLEQSLVAFGSSSEDGRAVLTCLKALSKFGSDREKGRDLIPSEIMNLVGSLPGQAGGAMMAPPGGGGMQPPGGMPPGMA